MVTEQMFGGSSMTYIPFNQLIDAVSALDKQEKDILVRILQETITAPEGNETTKLIIEMRENRFHQGLRCLYCGSDRVRRNGTYRNRQRYHCRTCNRTFNDFTGTPVHHTKHLAKWGKFLEFMIEGYSVRKCGELLEISKDTAFSWRHKVLHALAECPIPQLRGLVEADETYELYSEKGRREMNYPAAELRGINSSHKELFEAELRGIDPHEINA
jgi:transposase-like protein